MNPILFNTDMTKAVLDGRKTVTRRIVKPQPPENARLELLGDKRHAMDLSIEIPGPDDRRIYTPPYLPGDILYVRETWTKDVHGKYYFRADFDSDYLDPCETLSGGYPESCAYHPGCDGCERGPQRIRWHPSIHMPKEAARIFLRVTDVRVERLQDITVAGLQQEGILPEGYLSQFAVMTSDCYERWKALWDSTVKPAVLSLYGWEANPYVWVIEFERISDTEEGTIKE